MNHWSFYKVSELQSRGVLLVEDGNHGEYRPRPEEFDDGGTPFIRAADMSNGSVLFDTAGTINKVALDRIRKGIGNPGDILFSHKGTVGKLAKVPLDAPPFICSPQTTFWRVLKQEELDRDFLYSYMQSPLFINQWKARAGETDMAGYVSLTAQRELTVPIPAIEEQKAIAKILSSLDDKIELNRRMNATLEAIARALFKAWFVDFEPVHANRENRPSTSASPEIAKLFPSDFENGIPKGWCVGKLDDVIEAKGGTTPSTKNSSFWNGENCWATPKDLSNLRFPVLLKTERKITDEGVRQISSGVLPKGTLLLSSRAPIGYLAISQIPVSINQGFIAIQGKGVSNLFMLYWLTENMESVKSRANGSTFQEISKSSFREIHLTIPFNLVAKRFDEFAQPFFKRIVSNEIESQGLAKVRDTLLPKLISGRINVL